MPVIPADGLRGESLREASTGEFRQIRQLVQNALRQHLGKSQDTWIDLEALYQDRVIVNGHDGRLYAYPYTIDDQNQVVLGESKEVVPEYEPVFREAHSGGVFVEAVSGSTFRIRVIRAGLSGNKTLYPDAVLREAVPLFDGVRVFVKSDEEHIKGKGKDFRNLIGRLSNPKFIEGKEKDTGEIQADLELLDSAEVTPKLREAVERDMAEDLFGFSIDADGTAKKRKGFREAKKITKVQSVDLIIEPGAGGQIIKLIEAMTEETDVALREHMIEAVKRANNDALPEGLDVEDDDALVAAYREAMQPDTPTTDESHGASSGTAQPGQDGQGGTGVSMEEVDGRIRMVEARADMRVAVAESGLPKVAQSRLVDQFNTMDSFTEAQVTEAIDGEKNYLANFTESGRVSDLGGTIEAGQDRSEKVTDMLDDFFNPETPARSFRECYVDITGDKHVTGLIQNCDMARMREALGGEEVFREAINSATFSNALGDSIARALQREYNTADIWADWRWLVDVVPISDFRTQERPRVGGYGDLPAVAEDGAYNPLTSPGDEAATYALTKRGGTETISLETIANDDVGVIQRIPTMLGVAAKRTLYKFVYSFLDTNGVIYDTTALFTVGHNNLGTAALDAASFAAMRLAMSQQTEADSNERMGLVLRHLAVPQDLEETAFDMFVRNTNNDETFVQSHKPMVHVVPHWTDPNNWFGTADKRDTPLIELGFYGGREEPEIFIQDNPSQGSLFSNDQIKYKMRHIYNGAVMNFRPFQGNIVV
ncbi:MAG: hypothetical protein AB2604_10595 [Candidatus Thiodiazotropha taylori]